MLLAFDLDSTIVTRASEIPPRILAAILEAQAAGHVVAVLTGRPKASALPFVEQLRTAGFYAVNHGAVVMGPGDTVLRRVLIPADTAGEIIGRYGLQGGLEYAFMIDDDIYVHDPADPRWGWAHTLNRNVLAFRPELVQDADKVVLGADDAGPQVFRELSKRYPDLMKYLWGDGFLEITGSGADKGSALARICDALGVAQKDTVAFGDGVNDVTMIQWAGRSVAVGAAHAEVLAAADERVADPEENGVADWLEANLLGVEA